MSSCSTFKCRVQYDRVQLVSVQGLIIKALFQPGLAFRKLLNRILLCHYHIYNLMTAAVSYLIYHSPAFRADSLCHFALIFICLDKF